MLYLLEQEADPLTIREPHLDTASGASTADDVNEKLDV